MRYAEHDAECVAHIDRIACTIAGGVHPRVVGICRKVSRARSARRTTPPVPTSVHASRTSFVPWRSVSARGRSKRDFKSCSRSSRRWYGLSSFGVTSADLHGHEGRAASGCARCAPLRQHSSWRSSTPFRRSRERLSSLIPSCLMHAVTCAQHVQSCTMFVLQMRDFDEPRERGTL